jgi:hypothetical protein
MRRSAWLRRPGFAWAVAGAAVGILVLGVVLAVTAISRSRLARSEAALPVVTLLPRPSPTLLVPLSPTPSSTETPEPPAIQSFDSARIEVGRIVEVYGTEGEGLRLRADPSTTSTIRLLAGEAEVFTVEDGPLEADGRTWFYVVSPSDASRAGWAVSDYLRLAQ